MVISYTFAGSTNRYGYYAYIADGLLLVGEDWPHEGGTLYHGSYENAFDILALLKKKAPKLYNSINAYYKENPEVNVVDPTEQVKNRLKEDFKNLESIYRNLADEAYIGALRANSNQECLDYKASYELNRKLSETYRMMALRAGDYANQFKGA